LEDIGLSASEQEGQRRGRSAFNGVRKLLEGVQIRDETLMGWITEMIQATS
jgi:chromatin structure-remodeling complex subunit RSC9